MKKTSRYIFFSLFIVLLLFGCSSNNENNHTSEDIFQYEHSMIGDNSTIINIIEQLKHNEEFREVSLQTDTEPFGMTIEYDEIEAPLIEKEYQITAIYNATFLFALVDNVDWIAFIFKEREYKMTKEGLQDWYGKELSSFTSEKELKSYIQEQVEDENKINQFFAF